MTGAGTYIWTGTQAVLYLHVCPVVLALLEVDITDLAAEFHHRVQHRVQHTRGLLARELPELQHLFGMLCSSPVKSSIKY